MLFEVGETVVYPHHGAATITEVKKRIIKGEEKLYLKLNVTQGDLTIEVPAENVDLVGVRDVIGKEGLDKVFEVLRAPFTEEPTNWSRRYKANLEKLASGDVIKVSEVVRDLWRRDQDRGLSAGEKSEGGGRPARAAKQCRSVDCSHFGRPPCGAGPARSISSTRQSSSSRPPAARGVCQ